MPPPTSRSERRSCRPAAERRRSRTKRPAQALGLATQPVLAPPDSEWYESMSRTPTRDGWFPPPNSSFRRKPESRGEGGTNHTQTLPPTNASNFHTLVCRQPAGMGDWCESMSRTPPRDGFRHRPATPTTVARTTTAEGRKRDVALGLAPCRRVAAAGHCHYGPHFVICMLRRPESRGGGWRQPHPNTSSNQVSFHTLVCRHQPAWAIGAKACPGLRPGMDSGTGRRHQPPSPEQRQPRAEREM